MFVNVRNAPRVAIAPHLKCPCFGVWAAVCDPLSKAECVLNFRSESKRGPFVREAEKRNEERLGIKFMAATLPEFFPLLIVGVHREPGNVCI